MKEFDYGWVCNPAFFQDNRLDAHSDHRWYADGAEELAGESSFRYSLNGLWKFSYAPNYGSAIKGFQDPGYDCSGWDEIRVPAHIQMEGYDRPQYANVQYPWDGHEEIRPGQIPEHFNPVADYVRYFRVPEKMKGGPVYISFQGVESAMALWCNGAYVGYAEDTFTPSEFDLTPYLREGENKLAVQVFKWCGGSWCEDQDFFIFSGIFRDVYLFSVPEVHIWDLKVQTLLNDTFDRAELTVDIKASAEGKINLKLLREERSFRFGMTYSPCPGQVESCEETAAAAGLLRQESRFVIPVENPLLWSAEAPNLYKLVLEVWDQTGHLQEVISQPVGFRRFEIADGLMKLNGKRIVFKGVNRHEFSSLTGRVPGEAELWKDLVTMKQNNINAIRTCHYPNDSRLYFLCDQLGFYLIDECNLESHGSWDPVTRGEADPASVVPGDWPEWNAILLDRANSMYQRDKNHPAILIWSCGNESYGGKNIYDMSRFFHEQDPGRIVQYEGIFHDRRYPDTSDVESQMYTHADTIAEWLANDRSKPFICCEYMHAMGNSCGAMHKYTDLAETEPLYQGGFIWDYVDQSITKKDRYGRAFQAYGGDFDDRPNDGNFSGDGIVYGGDRSVSPKMQEVKYHYRNIAVEVAEETVTVTNRNLFVNTDAFDCVVLLEKEGRRIREYRLETHVEPGEKETYENPAKLPGMPGEYTVTVSFCLKKDTAWAAAGHEVAFGQGVFKRTEGLIADVPFLQKRPLQVVHGTYNLGVRGEGFEALFGGSGLVSYRYGGKEMLKTVPMPNFWRAPVDNAKGNDMMGRYGQWKLASLYVTGRGAEGPNPRVEEGDGTVTVSYRYILPTRPQGGCGVTYQVSGDGSVAVTLVYDPVEGLGDMPEFGMILKMDADYEYLEWYGNGPEETYADRQQGAKLGLYRNRVTDGLARYLVPQECGNRTGVRYAKVTDERGRGLVFLGDRMCFSALPYTPHEMENAAHAYELPEVHYTVIRASLAQMGVGGDDSWWSRVHDEYLLPGDRRLEFRFVFKGI